MGFPSSRPEVGCDRCQPLSHHGEEVTCVARCIRGTPTGFNSGEMPIDLPDDRPRVATFLADGSEVLLSPIVPEDRVLLEEGMGLLSVESRYTRFGLGLGHLTDGELEYLTNVDQWNHVAIAAAIDQEPAAVGRYIRIRESNCAELAVTVIDRYQRRGLGRLLLGALASIARADALDEFCFVVMPTNKVVREVASRLNVRLVDTGDFLEGRVPIAILPTTEIDEEIVSVMTDIRS